MADSMIQLDKKLVDSLVKEHISAAVLNVLADKKEILLQQMADQVLNLKVNERGEVDSYSSNNKYSWVEVTLNKELRSVIIQSVRDHIDKLKPEISKAVEREIKKSGSKVAQKMMDGLLNSLKYDFSFNVNLSSAK